MKETALRRITLTFDNGPDPETTPEVLDVLKRRDIRSTFFVLGDKLRDPARREICKRAHAEGHWIGNHTFNHLTPLGLSKDPDAHNREIGRTQELLADLAHPRKFFRPFGGGGHLNDALLSPAALRLLVNEEYSCVLWNVVPRDWENPEGWLEVAVEQCAAEEWPLIVLHDLPTGAMHKLDGFIQRLQDEGASFVQEFPDDCVPIRSGRVTAPVEAFVSSERSPGA